MNNVLQEKLAELPKSPGVYQYKNKSGEIIYIGKAAVLRNRVRQYFQASRARDIKTDLLIADIADIDWITVVLGSRTSQALYAQVQHPTA